MGARDLRIDPHTERSLPAEINARRQNFLLEMYDEISLEDWHLMVRRVVEKIKESGDAKLFAIISGYMVGLPPKGEGEAALERHTLRIVVDNGRVGVESTAETGRLSGAD